MLQSRLGLAGLLWLSMIYDPSTGQSIAAEISFFDSYVLNNLGAFSYYDTVTTSFRGKRVEYHSRQNDGKSSVARSPEKLLGAN